MVTPSVMAPINFSEVLYSYVAELLIFNSELSLTSEIGACIIIFSCYQIIKTEHTT